MQSSRGFSLLEMSFVIVIIAVMIGGGLSMISTYRTQQYQELTAQHLDLLEEGMAIFLAQHGRLPCPAAPMQDRYNQTFGMERTLAGSVLACQVVGGISSVVLSGNDVIYHGAAPVRASGLPDHIMVDGWGRRISYSVQQSFINNAVTNSA